MSAILRHTPGPWTAITIDQSKANVRANQDSVATVHLSLGSPVLMDRAGEGSANARLVAAAPELVEALQRIVGISWSAGSLAFDDAIDQARALLETIEKGDQS